MTDNLKESISAFMDDEISEIEIHRLLRAFSNESDEKARAEITRAGIVYQQISSVSASQAENALSISQHLDLHSRISSAIAEENVVFEGQPAPARSWAKPVTGFAVAASLVMAVFVGNLGLQQDVNLPVAESTPSKAVEVQTVSTSSQAPAQNYSGAPQEQLARVTEPFPAADTELHDLDAEKQKKLREYLNRHELMTRGNAYERTVAFKPRNFQAKIIKPEAVNQEATTQEATTQEATMQKIENKSELNKESRN